MASQGFLVVAYSCDHSRCAIPVASTSPWPGRIGGIWQVRPPILSAQMAFRVRRGGAAAGGHRPNETELIALGTAWSMAFCHCNGEWSGPTHAALVSEEVKREGGSTQDWTNAEVSSCAHARRLAVTGVRAHVCARAPCRQIYNYVSETAVKYMKREDVAKWVANAPIDEDDMEMRARHFEFVQSVVLSIVVQKTTSKCASEATVKPLLQAAQLDRILANNRLGGDPSWTIQRLITLPAPDANECNGERDSLWKGRTSKEINQSILDWLRDMKAFADGKPEAEWHQYIYKGDRKLTAISEDEQVLRTHHASKKQKTGGGMGDLDQINQGTLEVTCSGPERASPHCPPLAHLALSSPS